MKLLSILGGKLALFMCKLLKRGSSFPGDFAYKLDKKILTKLEKPKLVIAVTGSSGKGSTSKIVTHVLRDNGYKVGYNSKGSNERGAVITTILENATITGKTKVDAFVFEMDERYAKYVFPYFSPNYVVITNITRDQPPRQSNIEFIKEEISKSLNKGIELIVNGDDPFLMSFEDDGYKTKYYSISENEYSYKNNMFNTLNTYRCPKCNSVLKYSYYNIETLGDYYCESCSFKHPESLYKVTKINYDKKIIFINDKYKIKVNNDMLYSFYNTLAAFSVLSICGIDEKKITKSINSLNKDKKIFDTFKKGNKNIYVLNNKCENAQTYNQSILYTLRNKNKKMVVLGWKEISRRYEFDDLSWLYDIDFELLKNANVDKFVVTGPQKYDIAVRLKLAGISTKNIKIYDDLYKAKDEINSYKNDIYAILNFDYVVPFNNIMEVK